MRHVISPLVMAVTRPLVVRRRGFCVTCGDGGASRAVLCWRKGASWSVRRVRADELAEPTTGEPQSNNINAAAETDRKESR
eukprot:scaffold301_cov204-Alexandrium_tamarense.AAC.4